MSGFFLTKKAKDDLKAIGRYTLDTWGREQRNCYLSLLDAAFQNLADYPLIGRDCSVIRPGYRKQVIEKHIVFYRQIETGEIEIVRVLHERMDIEQHLLES
jgi:toxin ParE1/3/4